MEFIPENEKLEIEVPYYSEVQGKSSDGWSGHTTGDTVGGLKSKISAALGRLGGMVTSFQRGQFKDEKTGLLREAIRIHYTITNEHGDLWPGQIDIAALPVNRKSCRDEKSYRNKIDRSLRMAMYMTLTALQGAWNMRVLSPGYAPLMPWMLTPRGETFSKVFELSLSREGISALLPEPEIEKEIDVFDGEFREADGDS